jgi:guanine deaminase
MFSYLQPWNGYCNPASMPPEDAKKIALPDIQHQTNNEVPRCPNSGNKWMHRACEEALKSVQMGGGPFATVIVQIDDDTNKVIRYWVSHNHVTLWKDPTAHGETTCIRQACRELNVFKPGQNRKRQSKPQIAPDLQNIALRSLHKC